MGETSTEEEAHVVVDGDSSAAPDAAVVAELRTRIAQLEARLARLSQQVRTQRLVVVDREQRERMVAEVVGDVLELRIDLPPAEEGARTALLGFGNPGGDQLAAGIGLQLWARGELITELCWWEDDGSSTADHGR